MLFNQKFNSTKSENPILRYILKYQMPIIFKIKMIEYRISPAYAIAIAIQQENTNFPFVEKLSIHKEGRLDI